MLSRGGGGGGECAVSYRLLLEECFTQQFLYEAAEEISKFLRHSHSLPPKMICMPWLGQKDASVLQRLLTFLVEQVTARRLRAGLVFLMPP